MEHSRSPRTAHPRVCHELPYSRHLCPLARPARRARLHHSALICIEVLSKDDTLRGMQERIDDYLIFGAPNI